MRGTIACVELAKSFSETTLWTESVLRRLDALAPSSGTQTVAPGSDVDPLAQGAHDEAFVAPTTALAVPDEQGRQIIDPGSDANVPAGHGRHARAPTLPRVVYVPRGHARQPVSFVWSAATPNRPRQHAMRVPLTQKEPIGQAAWPVKSASPSVPLSDDVE